ncbi:MBL fold metallo-hydrolase [bacterium]|nr:MBL fold metallo-hydrolase [bacterium]
MISLQFLGAAGTVTGSKYALTVGKHRIFIDAGLFQGTPEIAALNHQQLAVDPAQFEAALLTHSHVDHCGYLPRLVGDGFAGPIYCTSATKELTSLMLHDCAKLQLEESLAPLYGESEVARTIPLLKEVAYRRRLTVVPGIYATFHEAGHILGSAWLELELVENGETVRLVMSGDLGREDAPILKDPEPPVACDYLVVESTYGDRLHSTEPIGPRLIQIVHEAMDRGGVLIIPAFAVERSQELIYLLAELDPALPIFLDSPMAAQACQIFESHRQLFDQEARERSRLAGGLLAHRRLKICATSSQSRQIFQNRPPYIVISASGMLEGGRVLHHLRRSLSNPKDTILLVGYQAEGTRGAELLAGAESLELFGEEVPVRARVEFLDGLSGHADYAQINRWLQQLTEPPRQLFLVHGEPVSLKAQQTRINAWPGWSAEIASLNQLVILKED